MPTDCLFCKIVAGDVPAEVVHEGERTLAFRDISPAAPTHVLVIPRDHHTDVAALAQADPSVLVELFRAAGDVARSDGLDATGYRLVTNTGRDAQQSVQHVHLHVLGGRHLSWPPG
ncbi:MAG: histidine triad nucleotide-binding protein [Pseudonocardiales bacterium]